MPRGAHLYIKGWLPFHIKCSRNCQWDERRSLGVGVQALASNPLQAAAVGNAAVVSVAERYVLLSWTQVNVFVKPDEQWWACSVIAMARKGAWSEPFDEVSLILFSSHVKSQSRTVLATSNAITCLWHCGMRHRGGRTVIQARWWNVGSRSRNAKGNAESDEQGRNVPKSASVADCPVVALKCL